MSDINSGKMSDRVLEFYNKHPYPPPVESLDANGNNRQDKCRRKSDFFLFWPAKSFSEELDILVAGCGTSQAAKYALKYPGSRIIGIDFSATSIQETEILKREYALENLVLLQMQVERAEELHQQFDLVICTGVLHHLPDPKEGLRSLRKVLKSDGALHLMVYAAYGRVGVYMIQEYCRRLGIGSSDKEIIDLANTLMAIPQDHPLARLLAEAPDFRRKSALADALLNPLDQAYTVPQLFELFENTGFRFSRWLRKAQYLPQCGSLAKTPHFDRLARLSALQQYSAVELLRGTMTHHSVILFRDDRPDPIQPVQFDNEEWRSYIPHRLPGTICIEEGLPPGAASVLINQTHTYRDLIMPINAVEKHWFDSIDGTCSISEILERTIPNKSIQPTMDNGRAFFQKLWWYDQVVFETKNTINNSTNFTVVE